MVTSLFFYLFSFIITACAVMVISSRNPVHSVLFLILAFFNSGALFVILGAEFLAMMLVIVYVGAVAVLFLFVVMMLDIELIDIVFSVKRYIPLAVLFSIVIISEIIYLTVVKTVKGNLVLEPSSVNNTESIGDVLYTKFFIDFQLSGIVLLLAMIGAIVLTHIYKPTIKRQNISHQNSVTRLERVSLRNPKKGEGIDA